MPNPQDLVTENAKHQLVERRKSYVSSPLLQKDPKTGTWKYVTKLQIPETDENYGEKQETEKDSLPVMDDLDSDLYDRVSYLDLMSQYEEKERLRKMEDVENYRRLREE
ncbi:unnamed protein product [Gongylonema pulchrum]|uniref:RNA polymerase II-associated factor 1 homolog n=1 Tax=Gongylonema pulchrum TaxID=637853 RepID=A0A183E9M2_9BILA|nr:unnamed protein product [Gongylonema pulchrum]